MFTRSLFRKPPGLAYASPLIATAFLGSAIAVLQGIYAKDFGVPLASIAFVILIARLFDGITDPLIGYWSDRHCASGGSRKPFIVSGGVLFILSGYFLYVPPEDVDITYFMAWYLAFVFSGTLFEIPHLAWANDLSNSSKERTTFYGWRAFMGSVGLMSFFILPLLPIFETSAITPQTLKWSVFIAGGLLLILLTLSMRAFSSKDDAATTGLSSNTDFQKNNRVPKEHPTKDSPIELIKTIVSNRPLAIFIATFFCSGFGGGICLTLLFLFIDSYLGLGLEFAWLYVVSHIFSISSVGLWVKLANRWSKQAVWVIALILLAIGMLGTGLQSPDDNSKWALLFFLTLIYSGYAAYTLIGPSLFSDVIDYSTWKYKRDRSGAYFSLYTLIMKGTFALGGALGLTIAGGYGFDATATVHSADTAFGLRLGVAWLPLPFLILALLIALRLPITNRRHTIIRRRLDCLQGSVSN
jgi:GPH family glycoside/pentoside/hexuronide:cation symporter